MDAERERLALHEEAIAHVQRITEEASERLAVLTNQAGELSAQAEEYLSQSRARAEVILQAARNSATNTITRARARAEQLTVRFAEHNGELLRDTESRLGLLEEQRRIVDEFALELRALSSSDVMVSLDETDAQV
jgi:hypothetical protein